MKKQVIIFSLLMILFSLSTNAAYLKDIPMTVIQPNGDTLHCYASGDEYFNYLHDKDAFTIIQNTVTGFYMYAIYEGDNIVASKYVAGTVNPGSVGLQPNVLLSEEQYAKQRAKWFDYDQRPIAKTPGRNHGDMNNLVVFIRFSDETDITTTYNTVNNMFNNQTAGYNSMYNYFKTTSYEHLTITSNFFPAPSGQLLLSYQDIYPRSYYQPYNATTNPNGYQDSQRTAREHALLKRAVDFVSSSVPTSLNIDYDSDGYVDNVCFVIKGNTTAWSTLLWPHRWTLYSVTANINGKRVYDYNFMLEGASGYFNNAVLSHEMQHTLSYPDLYHYNGTGLTPVGNWDIMESNPNPPQQSGAYMKWKYGNWVSQPTLITAPGTYTVNSIGSGTGTMSYRIPSSNSNEYFVIEHRNTANSFDNVYGTGLLIYRINTSQNGNAQYNGSSIFNEVYIFRPGGNAPAQNGTINTAHFGTGGRTSFNSTTNPRPFLTDGTFYNTLDINNISFSGNTATFTYGSAATTYTVTFNGNGSTGGSMSNQTFSAGVAQNLSANTFIRTNYIFSGWNTNAAGTGTAYANQQSVTIAANTTLYAQWILQTGADCDPATGLTAMQQGTANKLNWIMPLNQTVLFEDKFDTYTTGTGVAVQNPTKWTTWSGTPGSSEDPLVSTEQAQSPTKSVKVTGATNDLVFPIANFTTGQYKVEFDYFIPSTGPGAYFNMLHSFAGTSSTWATEIYFRPNGTGYQMVGTSAADAIPITYPINTWFHVILDVDLDAVSAKLTVNGNLINTWPFNWNANSITGVNQLGGMNFFSSAVGQPASGGLYYFDNFKFTKVIPNVSTINVFRNTAQIASNVVGTTYTDATPAPTSCYTVRVNCSAGGTSAQSTESCVTQSSGDCNPATNLTAVQNGSANNLNWTMPAKGAEGEAKVEESTISEQNTETNLLTVLDLIHKDSLRKTVQDMQDFGSRLCTKTVGQNRQVAQYLVDRLKAYGVENARIDSFHKTGNHWLVGNYNCYFYNAIGSLQGTNANDSTVIIGAHLDAISYTGSYQLTPTAPGADDNATGCAVMIETARIIHQNQLKPKYNIDFMGYDAEEIGLIGAHYDAQKRKAANQKVIVMLNNDMVGHEPAATGGVVTLHWYSNALDVTEKARQALINYTTVTPFVPTASQNGSSSSSDSYAYAQQGYKSTFAIEKTFSPYYHQTSDLIGYLNFEYCKQITRMNFVLLADYAAIDFSTVENATVNVFRNGTQIAANVSGTAYTDATPAPSSCYTVKVNCAEGGTSAQSNESCVNTALIPITINETPQIFTYNGIVKAFVVTSTSPAGLTGFNVVYSPTSPINAGNYNVTITRPADATYAAFSKTITAGLVINKATYNMSAVSFANATYQYDGTPKTILITGTPPTGVTVNYVNNTQIEVGVYSATANFTGDANNYNTIAPKTATLTITALPTFIITVNAGAGGTAGGGGVYTAGELVTITATPDEFYNFVKWDDDNLENPREITVINNATYTANFIVIDINDNNLSPIKIYPNPTTGELTITYDESSITKVEIYDIAGKQLSTINYQLSTINISHLQAGVYFVKLFDANKEAATVKIIKN